MIFPRSSFFSLLLRHQSIPACSTTLVSKLLQRVPLSLCSRAFCRGHCAILRGRYNFFRRFPSTHARVEKTRDGRRAERHGRRKLRQQWRRPSWTRPRAREKAKGGFSFSAVSRILIRGLRGVLRLPGHSTSPRLANGLLDEKRSQTNRNFVLRFGPSPLACRPLSRVACLCNPFLRPTRLIALQYCKSVLPGLDRGVCRTEN